MNEKFNEQQKEVLQLLKLLDDNDILPHVILAGSWAEYVYAQGGILPGYDMTLRTLDVDFLVKNMRKPKESISIPKIAKDNGYSISHDVLMNTTKIFSPGGLEIEFLISQKGSGEYPVLKTNLGVNAQALRHMEGVIDNAITADLFGMKVQVPCPETYVLHKMLINDVRPSVKQIKDRGSITRLLPYINFEKASILFSAFTKKEKGRVQAFIEKHIEGLNNELDLDTKIKLAEFITVNFPNIRQHSKSQIKESSKTL